MFSNFGRICTESTIPILCQERDGCKCCGIFLTKYYPEILNLPPQNKIIKQIKEEYDKLS